MRIHRHVLASRIDGVTLRPGRRQGNALWQGWRVRLGGVLRCRRTRARGRLPIVHLLHRALRRGERRCAREGGDPMSVMVYPLLGELLRDRDMTVPDLEREIARQYGMTVERAALERLMQPTPIRGADLEIAGAVSKILGIGLDDLFDVRAVRDEYDDEGGQFLSRSEERAMALLFDRQDEGTITDAEQEELDALIATQGQRASETWLREIAADRGRSVEDVRVEIQGEVQRALEVWRELGDDPDGQRKATEQAKDLPRTWAA